MNNFIFEKMVKIILLITLSVFFINCAAEKNSNQKTINVSSGKTIEILFETHTSPENGTVFLVECATAEKIVKEETIENDILEIWSQVEKIADNQELNEAFIKYKFEVESFNEKGEPEQISTLALFTAEKMENGKWKIDKIG